MRSLAGAGDDHPFEGKEVLWIQVERFPQAARVCSSSRKEGRGRRSKRGGEREYR